MDGVGDRLYINKMMGMEMDLYSQGEAKKLVD
jgi:hypothetical protein